MEKMKPAGLALMAAGVLIATAACSPTSPGPASSESIASPQSPSATISTTAPASPSASPGTSATVGALVEGFPAKLLPLMPGAKAVSSSFDKSATPATVALVATVTSPTPAVVDFYTKQLEAQGFKAVPGEAVGS